jgi:formylglycine-generating enzyme required for sulfatase activity
VALLLAWRLWPGPPGQRKDEPAGPSAGAAATAFAAALHESAGAALLQARRARPVEAEPAGKPGPLDSTRAEVPAAKVRAAQQDWAKALRVPAETSIDLGGGVKLELALVPPGRFLLGSTQEEIDTLLRQDSNARREWFAEELPRHAVALTRPFYAGRFTVTQEQFHRLMGRNPAAFQKGTSETNRLPVEMVTWYDAVDFCNRLSEHQGLRPCYRLTGVKQGSDGQITEAIVGIVEGADGFRLPTEAEWEYACRAGTRSVFHFGDALNGDRANCDGRYPYGTDMKGRYLDRPQPVGSYEPNALGLYDMHGNVWQWCQDWYGGDFYRSDDAAKDPTGPNAGKARVRRGGSWISGAGRCRAAYRHSGAPADRDELVGFRVVRPLD